MSLTEVPEDSRLLPTRTLRVPPRLLRRDSASTRSGGWAGACEDRYSKLISNAVNDVINPRLHEQTHDMNRKQDRYKYTPSLSQVIGCFRPPGNGADQRAASASAGTFACL